MYKKNILLCITLFLLSFNFIFASDEVYLPCGGNDEVLLLCPGDAEINNPHGVMQKEDARSPISGSSVRNRRDNLSITYFFISFLFIVLLTFIVIFIYSKRGHYQ